MIERCAEGCGREAEVGSQCYWCARIIVSDHFTRRQWLKFVAEQACLPECNGTDSRILGRKR